MESNTISKDQQTNPALNYDFLKHMSEQGCSIQSLIELRHDIHMYPEGGFQEHETHRKIKEKLISYGIEEENMRVTAKTGLVVDILGTGDFKSETGVNCIALRADLDALPIPE